MTEKTLRVLEFTKIREQLASLALTPLGAEKCRALVPYDDFTQVQEAQEETEEALVVLNYVGGNPLYDFSDVRPALALADKGATLAPRALLEIAVFLRACQGAKKALITERENTPRLTQKAMLITTVPHLQEDISQAILSEDEIADRASSELFNIRKSMRRATEKVKEKLNAMVRSATYQKCLQDPIVTLRNDRYVLPVKQEHRSMVPGLVHDQSASGATLFIEPMAVVELNNEIKEWEVKEQQEIQRILQALSAQVAPYAMSLTDSVGFLAELDFCFAKAQLSRNMTGCIPKMNREGRVSIIKGRHPLIDPKKVVPSTLWLGKDFSTLVITGPNTGGKTVTLKTVGLFTLMAQAGLQVPADLGTELSFFPQVFADIGDEQSIEQSLSTFSSHMTNIVGIMENVTPSDLVLFDELGAGTDPTEGAALAQAILTTILKRKVRTLATTHYSELKAFALSTPGVENASVEFSVETLRPTYRLSIGVPGKSNAFEISKKLGLSDAIIDDARELLSKESIRFEDVIANAEYHRQVAEKERALAEEASRETSRLRDAAERLRQEMEQQREKNLRKAKEEAKRILENARRESEEVIADLKKMKKQGMTPGHEAAQLRKRLEEGIDQLSEGLQMPTTNVTPPPKDVKVGQLVEIIHLNTKGTVLSKPDQKGEVQIQAGIMKMKVHLTQLRLVKEEAPKPKTKTFVKTGAASRTVPMELDVRGCALDEALPQVDQYLDEAVLAALGEVSIIHGKGTGILRAGIQQHLKRHPHVKSYRLGVYGEGE
ncbi:MAG: endonuclease MutS2 [Clostridia bacterium]|nr:endonuclease MutS2 [Clostridia bacterium]